ncbi:unnamed protein product [Gadus morhua 'NCC']
MAGIKEQPGKQCWKEKAGPKRCDEVREEQDLYGVYSVLASPTPTSSPKPTTTTTKLSAQTRNRTTQLLYINKA